MSLPGARKHLPDDLHGQEQGIPQEAPQRGQDDIRRVRSRGWPSPVSSEDNSWPWPLRFHLSGRQLEARRDMRQGPNRQQKLAVSLVLAPIAWNKLEEARLRDTLSHWEVGI